MEGNGGRKNGTRSCSEVMDESRREAVGVKWYKEGWRRRRRKEGLNV